MVSRSAPFAVLWWLTLIAVCPAGAEVGEPHSATAAFSAGTIPGTVRYQVVVPGVARTDLLASLGELTNLNVVAGPFLAQQMVWQEGRVRAVTVLTWVMQAARSGPIGVGQTRLTADGISLESNTVTGLAHRGGGLASRPRPPTLGVTVPSSQVHVGETFPVRFLARGDLPGSASDWVVHASFPGTWSRPAAQGHAAAAPEERRQGEPIPLAAWVVIPASPGILHIPPATARRVRPGDESDGLLLDHGELLSRGATVEVVPLPDPPAGFFGGIGDLSVSRRVLNSHVRVGEAALVEVAAAGKGNFPAMGLPEFQLPEGMHAFPAEVEDQWDSLSDTLLGERSWRVPLVASAAGEYVLPEFVAATYRPGQGFQQHRLPPLTVTVSPIERERVAAPGALSSDETSHPPFFGNWWRPLTALLFGFLAGSVATGVIRRIKRRNRASNLLPTPDGDAVQDAEQLKEFLDQWLLESFGVRTNMGVGALVRAGAGPGQATEVLALAEELDRIRQSPGLGDLGGSVVQLRRRMVRVLTKKTAFADRLPE